MAVSKVWLCTVVTSALISSCGGSSNSTNTPVDDSPLTTSAEILALENSGAIPALERGASLVGTDADNNGIRDDIDDYITSNYQGILQQSAARQSAQVLQRALLADPADALTVKAVAVDIARADNCIYDTFTGENGSKEPAQVSQELESITTNTKPRLLQYLAFGKALDGSSWALPTGDTCE